MTEVPNSKGIYRSFVDIEQNLFCMDFNPTDSKYPQQLINYAYNTELLYLRRFRKYNWCPEFISWDHSKQIWFKYGTSCEESVPDDYIEQLTQIVQDLHNEQVYKPAFYTKYAFVDKGQIKLFNFYSCSDYEQQPMDIEFFKPILNNDRLEQVESLAIDGKLDVGLLYKLAFTNYIKWPGDVLPIIYNKVYG